MAAEQAAPKTVDEYIASFSDEVQQILEHVRMTIRKAAPEAKETIAYGIPTFKQHGTLVSFAAYQRHIGLYPASTDSEAFNAELAPYRTEKSTLRFPLDKPIPYDMIRQIVELRVKENLRKAEASAKTSQTK